MARLPNPNEVKNMSLDQALRTLLNHNSSAGFPVWLYENWIEARCHGISPISLADDFFAKNRIGWFMIYCGLIVMTISFGLAYAIDQYETAGYAVLEETILPATVLVSTGSVLLIIGIAEVRRRKDWHKNKYIVARDFLKDVSDLEMSLRPALRVGVRLTLRDGLVSVVKEIDADLTREILIKRAQDTGVIVGVEKIMSRAEYTRAEFKRKVKTYSIEYPTDESSFDQARHQLGLAAKVGTKNEVGIDPPIS